MRINLIYIIILSLLLVSCFTGVEHTGKITLPAESKTEKQSPEDAFIGSYFVPQGCDSWRIGKTFYYTDDKLSVVFQAERPTFPDSVSLKGKIFTYTGYVEESPFGGEKKVVLLFECGGRKFRYDTDKTRAEITRLKYTPLIPPFIDLDDLDMARSLLKGRTLYIKTPMWYDRQGEAINGRKLVPVEVLDIRPGNNVLPVEVWFKDDQGNEAGVFMSLLTSDRSQYITFDRLFSFDNPRLQYEEIEDGAWEQITLSRVKVGMTKAECKLSLGNPDEVKKIPTYSGLREQWIYNSGAYLFFIDGLLSEYRL